MSKGELQDALVSENTDRKFRPFLLFNQTIGLSMPIHGWHGIPVCTLVLAGKSPLGPCLLEFCSASQVHFTSHPTQRNFPDYLNPCSSYPSKQSLQNLMQDTVLVDSTNCFLNLVSLTNQIISYSKSRTMFPLLLPTEHTAGI